MSNTSSGSPPVTARGDAQRTRILDAARHCFIAHGFHAANMASIAREAGISQGLIYRYFESKREIVLEIIRQQLAQNHAELARIQVSSDFVDEISEGFGLWQQNDARVWNVALFCEITAEASRDPIIAAALRESESAERAVFVAWLKRRDKLAGRRATAAQLEQRAVLMQCVIEGLAIRAVREPGLGVRQVRAMLRKVLPLALEG